MFEPLEPTHLMFVFVVALVLFGPKRLIEMSGELGRSIRCIQEYKEALKDELTSPPTVKSEPEEKRPSTTGRVPPRRKDRHTCSRVSRPPSIS